jgi:hypothetical protein
MKNIFIFATAVFLLLTTDNISAQNSKKDKQAEQEAIIKDLIASQRYIFKAQTVMPSAGRVRNLSSGYDVKVSKDTVIAYLPYFGRAYSAPINTTDGGIKFTSTNFTYKLTERKKGGWDIEIQPKDASDVQRLNFSVSSNGYTTLQVINTNRQPISFYGSVMKRKK